MVRNYPPEIRGAIAKVGAVTAIAAGDDITAQSFIDILKTMDTPRNLMPLVNYLTAEKILMQGYPRNAIQEYRKAANSNDLKYSSLARKKIADLEIRLNVIPPAKAIRELEGLRFAWGEIEFKNNCSATSATCMFAISITIRRSAPCKTWKKYLPPRISRKSNAAWSN